MFTLHTHGNERGEKCSAAAVASNLNDTKVVHTELDRCHHFAYFPFFSFVSYQDSTKTERRGEAETKTSCPSVLYR